MNTHLSSLLSNSMKVCHFRQKQQQEQEPSLNVPRSYQLKPSEMLITLEDKLKALSKDALTSPSRKEPYKGSSRNEDLLPKVIICIHKQQWGKIERLLEKDPSLARREVTMVCQGENCRCLLVHMLCYRRSAPISVIDSLVTLHPTSLLRPEEKRSRLPLHLALIKGASDEVIRYLCQARPQALQHADQDGNYPVHYGAMYGSSTVLNLFVEKCPEACRIANLRDRMPLHLLCARCFESDMVTPQDLELVIKAYPEATGICDRSGRTPLHIAACVQNQQWEFLNKLISCHPKALVKRDHANMTPYMLAKSASSRNNAQDIVQLSLAEATLKEWRKRNRYLPSCLLLNSRWTRNQQRSNCNG